MMLLFVTCATVLWCAVNCNEAAAFDHNFTTFDRNFTAMAINFKAKYLDKSYVKWQKLYEAEQKDLETVCRRYALMLSKDIRANVQVEVTRSYRDQYLLMGHDRNDTFEVDTLNCTIKFMNKSGVETGRMTYYLTEGHEPDSAFRFSLLQTTIVLTRFITDLWSKESKPSDFTLPPKTAEAATTTEVTKDGKGETTEVAGASVITVETIDKRTKKSGEEA